MNLQSRLVLGGFLFLSPLVSTIPAQAAACNNGGYTAAQLTTGGFSCTVGDKLFSDFVFTGFKPSARFGFNEPVVGFHTFNGQSLGFGPGDMASYSYKIQVVNSPAYIINYQTSTSQLGSAISLYKSLEDTSTPGMLVQVPAIGGTSPAYSYTLPGTKGPLTMAATIGVTTGQLTQFVDSYEQEPKIPVPGPLPLLGAGAAFGFTRKLRKRISASA